MRKQKAIEKAVAFFLILAFALSPIRFDVLTSQNARAAEIPEDERWWDYDNYIVIDEDTVWSGTKVYNNPDKPVIIVNGATLTIEKGTRVEILVLEVHMGRIIAEGDENDKIVFTKAVPDYSGYAESTKPQCMPGERGLIHFSDQAWVNGYDTEPSLFRYVEFDNMGSYDYFDEEECACPDCVGFGSRIFNSIFYTAHAEEPAKPDRMNPSILFEAGRLHVENSTFRNNSYADVKVNTGYYDGEPASYLKISNSNFSGNKQGTALISSAKRYNEDDDFVLAKDRVILKNNWYGSSAGPKTGPEYIIGGEIVSGDYTLDDWRTTDLITDPVIVIPGIMGSAEVTNALMSRKLVLDPILHTYDNLIASLEENGYEKNKNLFEFPYEWRDSNIATADILKNKIQSVKSNTGVSRVDLAAHSMGGLVARYYIESPAYQNDVDQLVTLGTPHKGSPKSYLTWEAGEVGTEFEDKVIKNIFQLEALHSGFLDLKKYIQTRVGSVAELLPDYDYLENASTGEMKNYPDSYPGNILLEFLNSSSRMEKMDQVNFYNIVGDIDGAENTIKKFRVIDSTVSGKWEHGMPENFYDDSTDQGIEYGSGDKTVPLSSATGISADEEIEIDSAHSDLPTKAQCYVIKELTGMSEDDCDYVGTFERIGDILTFGVFSPIDIQVIETKTGNWAGKNIQGLSELKQIPGAYYTGYDGIDNEFLTIPNPTDGEYEVVTEGTDNGDYKIEAAKITEDASGETKESAVEINGTAATGETDNTRIEVKEGEVILDEEETPVDIASIIQKVQNYHASKLITKIEKNFLEVHLKNIQNSFKVLERLENNQKMKPKAKEIAIKVLKRGINFQIDYLIKRLESQHAPLKKLNEEIRTGLIGDLGEIRSSE